MNKILFISSRNLLTSSGELRLIKNRAESLYSDFGVSTDFIVFSSEKRKHSEHRETINAGGKLNVISLSLYSVLSFIIGVGATYRKIVNTLRGNEYSAVVLSGIGMVRMVNCIKKFNIPVYVDIHGALEDALEVAASKSLIGKIKFYAIYYVDNAINKIFLPKVDGCFVVTDALRNYIIKRFNVPSNVSFHIVPCATKDSVNIVENREQNRLFYRAKYGISDETVVFVYSGGFSPWQCVEETINLYKCIADKLKVPSKMLLFSHMAEKFKEIVDDDERFIIDSHTPSTLKKALCAADFAFMLRKDCLTNNVAFPNKYLEYIDCCLSVIITPYVYEIFQQVKEYGLGIVIKDVNDRETVLNQIETFHAYDEATANKVLEYNSFKNRLSSFVSEIV